MCTTDGPASGTLRRGRRQGPALRQDVDVATGSRRIRAYRSQRRLFRGFLRVPAPRLDRAQQPVVHLVNEHAVCVLRLSHGRNRRQNQGRSAAGSYE